MTRNRTVVVEGVEQQVPAGAEAAPQASCGTAGQTQALAPPRMLRGIAQAHQPQLRQSQDQQQAIDTLRVAHLRLLPAKAMTFLIAKALFLPDAARIPAADVQSRWQAGHQQPSFFGVMRPTRHHVAGQPTRLLKHLCRAAPPLPRFACQSRQLLCGAGARAGAGV